MQYTLGLEGVQELSWNYLGADPRLTGAVRLVSPIPISVIVTGDAPTGVHIKLEQRGCESGGRILIICNRVGASEVERKFVDVFDPERGDIRSVIHFHAYIIA